MAVPRSSNNRAVVYAAASQCDTQSVCRVHSREFRLGGATWSPTLIPYRASPVGSESACKLLPSTPIVAIYYYYSARKLIYTERVTRIALIFGCRGRGKVLVLIDHFSSTNHAIRDRSLGLLTHTPRQERC